MKIKTQQKLISRKQGGLIPKFQRGNKSQKAKYIIPLPEVTVTPKSSPRAISPTNTVTNPTVIPDNLKYATDYLNARDATTSMSAYTTMANNMLSDVDKRIAKIKPTISSDPYADMMNAMNGWGLKRKQK